MADINQSKVDLLVNGQQAEKELKQVRDRVESLRQKLEEAFRSGTKESQKYFQGELRKAQSELRKMESGVKAVERTMLHLDKATPNDLNKALKYLNAELKNIERGSSAWNAQVVKIRQVKAELDKVNEELRQSESLFVRVKNTVNGWGASIAAGAAAVSGLVMAGKAAVNAYAEMEQEEANVRKYTGMTAEQVAHLNEEFKKMDTRTSREGLNQLAQEAGRLGKQSEEDVLGFVKAADKINVALDELGEGATLTLSKLTTIFGDEERLGTEQSLLAVGSVINELSQNCTASAPYLAEFGQRLAGVGAQANMTIPEIMGFGAVLDSQGQKVEMSATALSKVIMKMFQDPAKIAEATGMSVKEFSETCKRSSNEGLLMLLERLNELGGIDSLAPVFADMGEKGARASTVLMALAGNVDEVRKQQEAANIAFTEATSIDKEFEVQNTTVQAGLEKARKGFTEMAVTLGKELMPIVSKVISSTSMTMRVMLKVIQFVKEYRTEIVGLAAAVAAYYAIIKAQVAWNAFTGGIKKAIEGVKAFNKALMSNPYAAVAALVIALGTALYGFIKRQREAAKAADEHRKALELQREAGIQVSVSIGSVMASYNKLKTEWRQLSSEQEKNDWLAKNKDGFEKLGLSINSVSEADEAFINNTDKVVAALQARAKANALEKLYEKKMGQVYEEAAAMEDNMNRVSAGQGAGFSTKEWKAFQNSGISTEGMFKKESMMNELTGDLQEITVFTEKGAAIFNAFLDQLHQEGMSEAIKIGEDSVNKMFGSMYTQAKKEAAQAEKDAGGVVTGETTVDTKIPTFTGFSTGGGSSKKKKGGSSGGKTDPFKAEKEWRAKQDAINRDAYARGEKSKEEYDKKMLELESDYQKKVMKKAKAGSKEYLEARAAFYEAQKKLGDQAITDEYARLDAENKIAYLMGEQSHKEYTQRQLELDVEEAKARLDKVKEGSQEYLNAQAKYLEAKQKLEKEGISRSVEAEKEGYEDLQMVLKQQYADGEISTRAYNLAVEQAELQHLQNMVNLYKEGSEEYLKAEREYQRKSKEYQIKHAEDTKKIMEDMKNAYFSLVSISDASGFADEMAQLNIAFDELSKIEMTNEQKLDLEKAYQQAKFDIAKKYNMQSEMEALDSAQATYEKMADLFESEGAKKFISAYSTMVDGLSNLFSGVTDFMDAELSLQTALIEKRYDAEIAAAGNNTRMVKQLEAEKEAEIAKMKTEAADKEFKMNIAMAIAQGALSAINAWNAGVGAGFPAGLVLGPLMMAMSLTATGLQIAAMTKQHEAAMAQGFASGGYTMPGKKYQPAGIVHAGEWVASQELLANPTAAATIAQLDQAQRTNTIGQLDRQQVSASVSAPVAVAQASDRSSSYDNGLVDSIRKLNRRLDEPIYAQSTVTGDRGTLRANNKYEQLMRNKSKK